MLQSHYIREFTYMSDVTIEIDPPQKPVKPKNYLNNKDMLAQVILSKQQGRMTNELAKMFQLLCARYAKKGNYAGYSYNSDMQAYAIMVLCRTWASFNPEKSNNPFAYYTQCIKNNFSQYLKEEKGHQKTRDKLLVANGMNPSLNFQMDHSSGNGASCDYDGYSFDD